MSVQQRVLFTDMMTPFEKWGFKKRRRHGVRISTRVARAKSGAISVPVMKRWQAHGRSSFYRVRWLRHRKTGGPDMSPSHFVLTACVTAIFLSPSLACDPPGTEKKE